MTACHGNVPPQFSVFTAMWAADSRAGNYPCPPRIPKRSLHGVHPTPLPQHLSMDYTMAPELQQPSMRQAAAVPFSWVARRC